MGRYQLAFSNSSTGLQPQMRYESEAGLPSGDHYQATYAGPQLLHRPSSSEVQSGVEVLSHGGTRCVDLKRDVAVLFWSSFRRRFSMNQLLSGVFESD